MMELRGNNTRTNINSYSVWLEVHVDGEDKPLMIHPTVFDLLEKSISKARELSNLDGDKATREWEKFSKEMSKGF